MLKKVSRYWACQILGWSANIGISIFFITTFKTPSNTFYYSLFAISVLGILVTHLMRQIIYKLNVLNKPLKTQIFYFLILTIIFSIILGAYTQLTNNAVGHSPERFRNYSGQLKLFLNSFSALWLLLIWNLIYFLYHYVERNRKQQLDTLRLEATVKSLELQTIKSHINPHFIFNALNSIRALVDENPNRARTAITELSNLLRSSMQIEKMETVSLEKELNIVKDYLALEHMRFEERLRIKFDINPETRNQSIPPMMIQTLVENAIKHGISKDINGGEVEIISKFKNNNHEIIIRNTGIFNEEDGYLLNGFGLKSTSERLNILYHGKASFSIKNTDGGYVESKITLPIL
ncbi:MAG: histidine kinase [Ferruginibacter sp.]